MDARDTLPDSSAMGNALSVRFLLCAGVWFSNARQDNVERCAVLSCLQW